MNNNVEINFDDLVIAHKFAPEAAVTYTKKAPNKSVKIRFSKDFIDKYLDGELNVEVGYSENLNMLTINKVEKGGRTIVCSENGHGSLDFSRRIFPPHAEKVCFDHFVKHKNRWCCFFPSEND